MTVVVNFVLEFDLLGIRLRTPLDQILIQKRFVVFRIVSWCIRVLFGVDLSLAWSHG